MFSEGGRVDGVVAVVGNNSILHSEVLQQSQMIAMNRQLDPLKNPYLFENIYNETLDNLINQYVILSVAKKDTNIIITDEEVDRALDERIDDFINQAGSKELFEEMFGAPLRQIKSEYWNEIRNLMFIERYKFSKIQFIDVSRPEVNLFFSTFSDSIPSVPEYYNFSVIEAPFTVGEASINKTFLFLDSLRTIILLKQDSFENIAKKYSQDPGSSSSGGGLGFTKRGFLVPKYEEVAYSLNIGELSKPVKSSFGLHLIKLLDKRGEKISTQHILISPSPSKKDKEITLNEIEQTYNMAVNDPFIFDSVATSFSKKYNNFSGVYNKKNPSEIPYYIISVLDTLSAHGFSVPLESEQGVFIVFLYKHALPFFPTIENSWDIIYQLALQEKQNRYFNLIIDRAKQNTYIKYF